MSDDDFDFTKPWTTPTGSLQTVPSATLSAPFKPANSKFYGAKFAEQFFRAFGKAEQFAVGMAMREVTKQAVAPSAMTPF